MNTNLLDYLRETVDDDTRYSPKVGRNPRREKYLDSRRSRNQNVRWLARLGLTRLFGTHSEYGLTNNGVIWYYSYRDDGRTRYLVNGFRRRKKERRTNGWNDGRDDDFRWKRGVYGKHSRTAQRAWKNELECALKDFADGF